MIGIAPAEISPLISSLKINNMNQAKIYTPTILSRIPSIDKPSVAFPNTIVEVIEFL